MAQLTRLLFWRHLRAEASSHVLHTRHGQTVRSVRGASFWFLPLSASIAEVPMDDRDLPLMVSARTEDFQSVTTMGVVTWRVGDPERLASRVDFALDLEKGQWVKQPIEQLGTLLSELAQQIATAYLGSVSLSVALVEGVDELRARILAGLRQDPGLADMGLAITSVRISAIRPDAEVERALQTPARESLQQEADKATYERRALAVERERAIAENELKTKIELARRESELIAQKGANEKRRLAEDAEAKRIEVVAANERAQLQAAAEAERTRLAAEAEAGRIRWVEGARNEAERAKVDIYRELPSHVLMGLAAQHVADNLPSIQHLTLTPDLWGPALTRLAHAEIR